MKATLDHIGIAVRDLEQSLAFFRDALGLEIEISEEVRGDEVRVHFLGAASGWVELLESIGPRSAVAAFLERRGPGLHHVAFRVPDLRAALAELKARGVRLIDEEPRAGAHGARIAFIHPASTHGVLVELKQEAG